MHLKIDWKWFSQKTFGDYCYVFHRKRIHWYSDCKRISKQEVELPMHESDSYEVSSHGHYRPQERQRKTRDRADRRKNWLKLNSFSLYQSQDDKPGTHNSQRQAARIIGMSRRSVQLMLKRRGLHPFKRMPTSAVNVSWLTKPFFNFSQIFYHFLFGNSFTIWVPVHPFFSETRNNNRQIVFCENHFQSTLQMRYLHNSIFNSNYVIKRHSVTSLMMFLKFIHK